MSESGMHGIYVAVRGRLLELYSDSSLALDVIQSVCLDGAGTIMVRYTQFLVCNATLSLGQRVDERAGCIHS